MCQGKRIGKKKKTTVKTANLNPYYNESFVFVVEEMSLKKVSCYYRDCKKVNWTSLHMSSKKGWLQQCSSYAVIVEAKFLDCIPGFFNLVSLQRRLSWTFQLHVFFTFVIQMMMLQKGYLHKLWCICIQSVYVHVPGGRKIKLKKTISTTGKIIEN